MAKYHGSKKWELYEIFTDWLVGIKDDLPDEVLKEVTHVQLITAFSRVPILLEYMNKHFNTYDVYSIDKKELAEFVRKLVISKRIRRNYIWWFANLVMEDPTTSVENLKLHKRDEKLEIIKNKLLLIPDKSGIKPKKKREKKSNTETKVVNLEDQFKKENNSTCKNCPLYTQPQVLFDYDSTKDVDVLFVFEAPGATEVEKGIPVVGKSGQIFREYLEKFIKPSGLTYFITNTCLCRPPDNRTPTKKEIQSCAPNLEKVIQLTNPKLIVAAGSTAKERLGIKKNGILNTRGFYKYSDSSGKARDVFLTVHPSYLLRQHNTSFYEEDFSSIISFFGNKQQNPEIDTEDVVKSPEITRVNGKWTLKFDDKIYKKELVNIEHVRFKKSVLYTLRDGDKKEYYWTPETFYHYVKEGWGPAVEDPSNVNVVESRPNYQHPEGYTLYESDLQVDQRHSIDYYFNLHQMGLENKYQPRILYFDIETFSIDGTFIEPSQATGPVVLNTVMDHRGIRCYVVSQPFDIKVPNAQIIFVNSEEELIERFVEETKDPEIDIVTAWNISYDYPYIYNRMRKLKMNPRSLSPINVNPLIEAEKNMVRVPGLVTPDLLTMYKIMTYGNRDSYKLDYICQLELGEGKTEGSGSEFWEIWKSDKAKAIRYNIDDVILMQKLDQKLQIVPFFNIMRKISACNWQDIEQMSKKVDSLLLDFAKKRNQVVRTRKIVESESKTKIGAYVRHPEPGLFDKIYITDFSGLYPSIIRTYNIGPDTYIGKIKYEEVKDYLLNVDRDYTFTIYEPQKKTFKLNLSELKDKIGDKIVTLSGCVFENPQTKRSLLFDMITELVNQRAEYKKLMKTDKENYTTHNNFQRSVKENTNSIYGVFGFNSFRWYNPDLVNSVTLTGQFMIKFASVMYSYMIQNNKLELTPEEIETLRRRTLEMFMDKDVSDPNILYSDTDSVDGNSLIWTDFEGELSIAELFDKAPGKPTEIGKDSFIKNVYLTAMVKTYNLASRQIEEADIKYIKKHRVKKRMYRILPLNEERGVIVTEDHSIMVLRGTTILPVSAKDVNHGDRIIVFDKQYKQAIAKPFKVQDLGVQNRWVYDVEVNADDHVFIANYILVHNSVFVNIKDSSKEFMDKATDFININVFTQPLGNIMGYPQSYMALDYKGLYSGYFTEAKKKYALYNLETNELEITGLEIVRSDYPKLTRERLKEILTMLLVDKKPVSEIEQKIEEYRQDFMIRIKNIDLEVARPMPYARKLSSYKKVPSHVFAMELWNALVSKDFRPGTKARMLYAKYNLDLMTLAQKKKLDELMEKTGRKSTPNFVAIPEGYKKKLPKFIDIDIQSNLNFVWNDRVSALLSGLYSKVEEIPTEFDI